MVSEFFFIVVVDVDDDCQATSVGQKNVQLKNAAACLCSNSGDLITFLELVTKLKEKRSKCLK